MFHVLQAQSIFVLVNDLYIGDPLKQIKHRKYAYSSKTLLINPSPAFNRISLSKSMHIMPRGLYKTDPFTYSYFVTLSLEYPKGPCLIGILAQW